MKLQRIARTISASILFLISYGIYAEPIEVTFEATAPADTASAAVGEALTDILDGLLENQDNLDEDGVQLLSALELINDNKGPAADQALAILSPQNNSSNTSFIKKFPSFNHLQGLGKRLAAFRKGSSFTQRGFRLNGVRLPVDDLVTKFLNNIGVNNIDEGGLLDNQISGFITGDYVFANQTATTTEAGFSGYIGRLVAGADYRVSNSFFMGVYGSMFFGTLDLDNQVGDLSANEQRLAAYASYYPYQNVYFDIALGSALRQFSMSRRINFVIGDTTFDQTANSSPKGNNLEGKIGVGMDFPLAAGAVASVNTGVVYGISKINQFDEQDGGGFNLSIDKQSVKNIMANLGGQVAMNVSTSWAVLSPYLGMNYTHEFADDGDIINARFVSDPNANTFSYTVQNADPDYIDVTAGSSAIFAGGISAFAQINALLLFDNFNRISVTAGARKEF